jgi:hypothetical protein
LTLSSNHRTVQIHFDNKRLSACAPRLHNLIDCLKEHWKARCSTAEA